MLKLETSSTSRKRVGKEFDSSNSNFTYEKGKREIAPNKMHNYTITYGDGITIKFKFLGSRIRYIGSNLLNDSLGIHTIIIDGNTYTIYPKAKTQYENIYFELKNLEFKEHKVKIIGDAKQTLTKYFNAIDIDENGKLIPLNPPITAQSITLDKLSINLLVGNTDTLTPMILPKEVSSSKVVWSSSDEKIATVDANGKVVAVAKGTVTITAATNLTAKCTVTVTEPNKGRAILEVVMSNSERKEYTEVQK